MPYRDLPATQAMQPLKLKEYLATGLPCVVSRIPAVAEWADCLNVVDDADEFASTVISLTERRVSEIQLKSRERLDQEDWSAKAEEFKSIIEEAFSCRKQSKPSLAVAT
jgi:glycosyltransferase involved in cell wall biosynthesis